MQTSVTQGLQFRGVGDASSCEMEGGQTVGQAGGNVILKDLTPMPACLCPCDPHALDPHALLLSL